MIKTAFSTKNNVHEAVNEISYSLGQTQYKLIIFFASPTLDSSKIAQAFYDGFNFCETVGCTSAGEFCGSNVLQKSVVAMAFDEETIEDVHIEVLEDIENIKGIKSIVGSFESYYNTKAIKLNPKKYLSLLLMDGLTTKSEKILYELNALTNLPFIGGCAGDENLYEKTYVYHNGKAYSSAALFLVALPKVPFAYLKTQGFEILPETLTCTKTDESGRIVYEFNHEPAALAYAKALNIPVSALSEHFIKHPIGQVIDKDPFVRSPKSTDGHSVTFHANVLLEVDYHILKNTSIIANTKIALAEKTMSFGPLSGLINFNCVHRTLQLYEDNQIEAFGEIFKDFPSIGFSTYGETYLGFMNQTSTMLLFGQ